LQAAKDALAVAREEEALKKEKLEKKEGDVVQEFRTDSKKEGNDKLAEAIKKAKEKKGAEIDAEKADEIRALEEASYAE
jgi:hypothetical protein